MRSVSSRPITSWRATTARCCRPACWPWPAGARSTCMARCCRDTGDGRPSTGRSQMGRPRPAQPCTTWSSAPTPAPSSRRKPWPSVRTMTPSRCPWRWPGRRAGCCQLCCRRWRWARRPDGPMDLAQGSYFGGRRPEDGRIQPDWPGMRVHAMIRAVAPPFPGAFIEVAGRRVVFVSSHLSGQAARHPQACAVPVCDGRPAVHGPARMVSGC